MCCITYKGVKYHYAFEFDFSTPLIPGSSSINNDGTETFKIVISKYRDKFENFSALCFNNDFTTISYDKFHIAAFLEVFRKIVDFTLSDRKAFFDKYGKVPFPLQKVEDKDFIDEFERCKNLSVSQIYNKYTNQIKMFLEEPEPVIKDISEKFDEYVDMKYFYFKLFHIMPNIKNFKSFTI